MKFVDYFWDNGVKLLGYCSLVLIELAILLVFRVNPAAVSSILVLSVVFGVALFLYDFFRKRGFYGRMQRTLRELDKKYLLAELLDRPGFLEGRIFYEVLFDTDRSLAEEIADYARNNKEFRDYIELWVHEVKTPLTGLKLSLHKSDRVQKTYLEEIENCINQALFYSKVGAAEKDYVIKPVGLRTIVNSAIKSNKDSLIKNGMRIETENLNMTVHSDPKWLEFIINQVILNAVKYRGAGDAQIKIFAQEEGGQIVLRIRDNGIGIKKSELKQVLKKGFTGSNDRRRGSSTGMGLYISNELSRDMGHKLEIDSVEGEFTEVKITFGNNRYLVPIRDETLRKR